MDTRHHADLFETSRSEQRLCSFAEGKSSEKSPEIGSGNIDVKAVTLKFIEKMEQGLSEMKKALMGEESGEKTKQKDEQKKEGDAEKTKKLEPEKEKALDAAVTALLAADSKTQDEAKQKLVTEFKNSGDPDLALRHLQQNQDLMRHFAVSKDQKENLVLSPAQKGTEIQEFTEKDLKFTLKFLLKFLSKLLKFMLDPQSFHNKRRFTFFEGKGGKRRGFDRFFGESRGGNLGIRLARNEDQVEKTQKKLEENPEDEEAQKALEKLLQEREALQKLIEDERKRIREMADRYNRMVRTRPITSAQNIVWYVDDATVTLRARGRSGITDFSGRGVEFAMEQLTQNLKKSGVKFTMGEEGELILDNNLGLPDDWPAILAQDPRSMIASRQGNLNNPSGQGGREFFTSTQTEQGAEQDGSEIFSQVPRNVELVGGPAHVIMIDGQEHLLQFLTNGAFSLDGVAYRYFLEGRVAVADMRERFTAHVNILSHRIDSNGKASGSLQIVDHGDGERTNRSFDNDGDMIKILKELVRTGHVNVGVDLIPGMNLRVSVQRDTMSA
ncbi:hypothetical protein HY213_02385 [Candidatus Peregrinibacteria bacterium]|nr:hypothetical protein [Candidatus Peregrinibacteria bacterium]